MELVYIASTYQLFALSVIDTPFPYELSRDITEKLSLRYGNSFPPTFPEVLLAQASPIDWPIVTKHANMTSSRGSINAEPATITSESFNFTVVSARDQSKTHQIAMTTALPAWAWPTRRRLWRSLTAHNVQICRCAC